jgi:hypothetical protein
MFGLSEVITLMLALGGFGVDANPRAASADAVLAYGVDEADLIAHVDVVAIGPRNYRALIGLPDDAGVKAIPELHGAAKRIKANLEGIRGMAKAATGVDVVSDITSLTVFVDLDPTAGMQRMVVARGSFPTDLVDKIARLAGKATGSIDGRTTVEIDPMLYVGTTKDGALIAGPRSWVEARIDDDWKKPTRKKGSAWAAIARRIDAKPFLLVAAKADPQAAAELGRMTQDSFLADLVAGHELAILAIHSDGVAFHWQDRTQAGLDRVALATEGVIELTRAGHMVPRGAAKLVIAALDSYAGHSKDLDALIAHKDDLWKVIDDLTGDGKFKVDTAKDGKARTLTLRATGKTVSDVIPAAVVIPAALWLFADATAEAAPQARPARKQRPPIRKQKPRQPSP